METNKEEERVYLVKVTLEKQDDPNLLLNVEARLPLHMANDLMNQFGFDLEPKPRYPRGYPVVRMAPKVTCAYRDECTDPREKCSECSNNRAKSYFKPKEEG